MTSAALAAGDEPAAAAAVPSSAEAVTDSTTPPGTPDQPEAAKPNVARPAWIERVFGLWRQRTPTAPVPVVEPPASAVITSATYKVRVDQDVARIQAELSIRVLGRPWAELPVAFGPAVVSALTATDDKILLQGTAAGRHVLLFPRAGDFQIRLELVARVRNSPDERALEFDCPAAGIGTLDLTVPGTDQVVDVLAPGISVAAESAENTTHVTATLGAATKIAVRWHPRNAPATQPAATVQNALEIRVAAGLVHTHSALTYEIHRGPLDQLRIAVPLDDRILDVTATGLRSWQSSREEKHQVVTIDLQGSDARYVIAEVHSERAASAGTFVPAGVDDSGEYRGVHALGDVRETGWLVLRSGSDQALSVEQHTGILAIEPTEVPEPLRKPGSLFFRYETPRFQLQLAAQPVAPRLLVEQRCQFVLRNEELQVISRLSYTAERAPVEALRLRIPPGLEIDRIDSDRLKEFHVAPGKEELTIHLREKCSGTFAVVVTAHRAFDPEKSDPVPLPLLEPVDVANETGAVHLDVAESLAVTVDQAATQGAVSEPVEQPGASHQANVRRFATWTYTHHPAIAVRVELKAAHVTGGVATLVQIRRELFEVVTLLNYKVEFAGVDTYQFAVPEAVSGKLQVELGAVPGAAIREQSRADEAVDGWVTWTVVLDRPLIGTVPFQARYELKPAEQDRRRMASIAPLRILNFSGEDSGTPSAGGVPVSGELVVTRDRSFASTGQATGLEAIDVTELKLLPQQGDLAFRYARQADALTSVQAVELSVTRNEIQPVVDTIVSQALIEAILTEEKSVTYRCRYRLKTNERQRLMIELPAHVEVLDTLVAGKSVNLEKGDSQGSKERETFLVDVSRRTPSDESFVLALALRVPFKDTPLRGRGGNLKLPLPRLGGTTIAVQQLRTLVWVPSEFSLVGVPDDFSPARPVHLTLSRGAVGYVPSAQEVEDWFGDSAQGQFAFTPVGKAYLYQRQGAVDQLELSYWRTAWFTWTISGAMFVVALVLVRTSWQNRLIIVLLTAFGATLYALEDADLVLNLLGVARFGLIALVAWWLIAALTRPRAVPTGNSLATGVAAVPGAPGSGAPPVVPFQQSAK